MHRDDVIEKKEEILNKKEELRYEIRKLNRDLLKLQKKCNHELVFKFDDHELHKVGPIYNCVCPICDKRLELYFDRTIDKTCFRKSKVVDLTEIRDYFGDYECRVKDEVLSNVDFFYDENRTTDEIKEIFINKYAQKENKESFSKEMIKKLK